MKMNHGPFSQDLPFALFTICCLLVKSEPSCDQTQFLHPNGTCVACPVCGPGEQLSEDCGFGDGGDGVCIPCEEGKFSADTGVAPCRRCIQCRLLNRLEETTCSPACDAHCGRCLPGYYELRSRTGEAELLCVPCYNHDRVHEECWTTRGSHEETAVKLLTGNLKEKEEKSVKEETFSLVLIGSATGSSVFLVALLLWAFLLTAERFKKHPGYCPKPEALLSADDLHYKPVPSLEESTARQSEASSQMLVPAQDPLRGLNSQSHEIGEVHPTSIVINVTTNVQPSREKEENVSQQEEKSSRCSMEEMERQLQTIWDVAQGHSIEKLDYDSVQDLSLLLDSAEKRDVLKALGRSLGVPPQIIAHLRGFQDLFEYLRTSTYTLLPQLAQAAALLPHPEVVSRVYRAVVNKSETP